MCSNIPLDFDAGECGSGHYNAHRNLQRVLNSVCAQLGMSMVHLNGIHIPDQRTSIYLRPNQSIPQLPFEELGKRMCAMEFNCVLISPRIPFGIAITKACLQ